MKVYKSKTDNDIYYNLIEDLYLSLDLNQKYINHTIKLTNFDNLVEVECSDDLLLKFNKKINGLKQEIENQDIHREYLENKRLVLKDFVSEEVYKNLLKENEFLAYRLRRVIYSFELDLLFIEDANEFEVIRNYFYPKTKTIFTPQKGDCVKYKGELYILEKFDKKIVLQNIRDFWLDNKLITLKDDINKLIESGEIEKYNYSKEVYIKRNLDVIIVEENSDDKSYWVCENNLTEEEINYLMENGDTIENEESSEIFDKLRENAVYLAHKHKQAVAFCEVNEHNILEELEIDEY